MLTAVSSVSRYLKAKIIGSYIVRLATAGASICAHLKTIVVPYLGELVCVVTSVNLSHLFCRKRKQRRKNAFRVFQSKVSRGSGTNAAKLIFLYKVMLM